jgi:hypothetical protein
LFRLIEGEVEGIFAKGFLSRGMFFIEINPIVAKNS